MPDGTLGNLCPLRYKGGGAVFIACMYVCMSSVWLGVLRWAGNALLFFPLKIMGNSSCYMFFTVKPIFGNELGLDNKG